MDKRPLVSFCFTTYKRPDILIETIRSIMVQSIRDWEVVVSDNDPDQSGRKIESAFDDERIRYFPNGENLGMKKSFNKSLDRSRGSFIVMIADDDPVYPDMLETLFKLERQYPGYGMYMGGGDLYCMTVSLAELNGLRIGTNTFLNNEHDEGHIWQLSPEAFINRIFYYDLLSNYLWSCCLVRREVLLEMGGVPDYGTPFLGDYAYMTIVAAHSGVVVINKALGRQTIHPENFGRAQNDQLKLAVTAFRDYVSNSFKKKDLPASVYPAMDRFLGIWVGRHLAFLFHYYRKNNLPLDPLKKAEREIFAIPLVKKYYTKYRLRRDYPALHDAIVRIKKDSPRRAQDMVKYSIILPVRNGGDYLKLAVQSILDQTFPHFELLVLDNCSNDGTAEWLKVKSGQDERLRIFRSNLPLSIEENWGRITKIPKQEFVTLIGHDDLLFPEYLATMDALVRHHPGASLYQTHFRYIDGKGREIRKCLPMPEKQDAPQFLGDILSASIDIMGTGFMMRSADYDRLGGIPPYPNLLFADFALWLELTRIAYKATSRKEEFAFRKHLSTTSVSPDIKMQQAFAMLVDYLGNLRKQDKAMEDELDRYGLAFLKKNCRGLAHRLLRTPFARRDGLTVTDFLDDCKQYAKRLVPKSAYDPRSDFSVLLAAFIDSNAFTRNLFLLFKKMYSKPVLN